MQASFPNQNVVYSLAYSYLYGYAKKIVCTRFEKNNVNFAFLARLFVSLTRYLIF